MSGASWSVEPGRRWFDWMLTGAWTFTGRCQFRLGRWLVSSLVGVGLTGALTGALTGLTGALTGVGRRWLDGGVAWGVGWFDGGR